MTDPIIEQINNADDCEYLLECLFGLSDTDRECYKFICENEPVENSDISETLGKNKSTINKCLRNLEEFGLTQKERVGYPSGGYKHVYYKTEINDVRSEIEDSIEEWESIVFEMLEEFENEYSSD